MDATLSPEQQELRQVLRRFLADPAAGLPPREAARTPEGHDPARWRGMCELFELPGLLVGAEYGGLGLGWVEQALVLEEMGRALCPSPYLASAVLATSALLHGGDEAARKEWLPGIAAGTTVGALAHRSVEVSADGSGGEYRLTGSAGHVLDGHVADLLVLPVPTSGGMSLFLVRAGAPGLTAQRLPTLDETRAQARLELREVPARLLGQEGQAEPVLALVRDLTAVALAAEAVGGAARCLEMAVDHLRTRRQFGRPLGAFQALKHRCADLYTEVETARSAAYYAAWAAAHVPAELPDAALAAQAYCAEAYRHAAAENIQLHGGIGFTWEHDAHLYLKRATAADLLFGSAGYQRGRIADRLEAAR